MLIRGRRIHLRHQPELQIRHFAEDTLGLCGILNTRQFDHDAVTALSLHQRLRHTQLIDPVAQCSEVLAYRIFNNVLLQLLGKTGSQAPVIAFLETLQQQFGTVFGDRLAPFLPELLGLESRVDESLRLERDITAHTGLTQYTLHIVDIKLATALQRCIYVNL